MLKRIHAGAGALALLIIALFWLSTVVAELLAPDATVAIVKQAIPWGFLLLVPALAAAGGSGFALSQGRRRGRIGAKARRMQFLAANGLLILMPSALFLASKAGQGVFDGPFYAVQALELVAGAFNIVLLGRNMRDGMAMRRAGTAQ